MSITLIVELSCDHGGCDVAYAPDANEMTSVMATRTGSRRAGWTRSDGKDFCPTHGSNGEAILVGVIRGLVAKHLTDDRIGAGLDMSRHQVQALRSKHGIPPGNRPGRPPSGFIRNGSSR